MYLTGVCKSCNLQVPVQRELDLKSSCILTALANSVVNLGKISNGERGTHTISKFCLGKCWV